MITVLKAILSLDADAEVTVGGEGTDNIKWGKNTTPIPISEIDAEITRLTQEFDALDWKRSREAEYPSVADLVVALYDTDDKSAVEAKRASVKAKYPNPE